MVEFSQKCIDGLGILACLENPRHIQYYSINEEHQREIKRKIHFILGKSIKSDEGKILTNKIFKHNFGLETYFEIIPDKTMRRNICAFRISAHRLQIERERYTGLKIDERLCTECNVIEDKTHFLFECKKFDSIRKDM